MDVFSGAAPLSVAQAMNLLSRIERRDANVLQGLVGTPVMFQYFQTPQNIFKQEWGVAKEAGVNNPECILVSGGAGGIAWGPYLNAGLIPLAHSHPFHRNTPATTRALTGGGVLWDDINGVNPQQDLGSRLKVFPSAGDIAFCAANDLAWHTVKTPYCSVFGGPQQAIRWIVNHDAHANFALAPRLDFRIFDVEELNQGHYRAGLVAMENNVDIWRKHGVVAMSGGGAGLIL